MRTRPSLHRPSRARHLSPGRSGPARERSRRLGCPFQRRRMQTAPRRRKAKPDSRRPFASEWMRSSAAASVTCAYCIKRLADLRGQCGSGTFCGERAQGLRSAACPGSWPERAAPDKATKTCTRRAHWACRACESAVSPAEPAASPAKPPTPGKTSPAC